jgi:hypothetical protein
MVNRGGRPYPILDGWPGGGSVTGYPVSISRRTAILVPDPSEIRMQRKYRATSEVGHRTLVLAGRGRFPDPIGERGP